MSVQLDVGSWGLFCGHEGRQIVLVDNEACGPSSARKYTRRIPRELLLDENRITHAYQTGHPSTETISHHGKEWVVVLRPILSPRSGSLIGVLAGVFPSGGRLPGPPLVGAWEWEIERNCEGQPTPQRRTYWDRNLFDLYAVNLNVAQQRQGYWEAGEWASELIAKSDQMRVNSLVRDGIQEGLMGVTGMIRCLTYNIVTGYGSESQGRKHLRLIGQIVPVEPDDDKIIIQGFSFEVPDTFHDMAFVQDVHAGRVDDVLRGVMALAREPVAVVDVETLEVLMTSAAWWLEDFGHVGGLGEFVVHDPVVLYDFTKNAAEDTENSSSMKVDLRRLDGSVQRVSMTVIGARSGVHGRDAVIRLDL